jgi:hypothetical protein
MTYKDKTTAAKVARMNTNAARKFEVFSEGTEGSITNELSDVQVLIKTSSGVCVTAVGLNLEDAVLFSDTLH